MPQSIKEASQVVWLETVGTSTRNDDGRLDTLNCDFQQNENLGLTHLEEFFRVSLPFIEHPLQDNSDIFEQDKNCEQTMAITWRLMHH